MTVSHDRFSELSGSERLIEIVRWLCVLPAAVLGEFTASLAIRAIVRIVGDVGRSSLGNSPFAAWFVLLICYGLPKAVFVLVGSQMAPRRQLTSSIVLTVLGFSLSLLTHVLGQHLAGNHVGGMNYVHLAVETGGLLCGLAALVIPSARTRLK